MINYIVYIIIVLIIVFVFITALKALLRGIKAKKSLNKEYGIGKKKINNKD